MEELVELIQKTYGLAGLLILLPIVAAVVMYRDNRKIAKDRDKEIKGLNQTWEEKVDKLQNQRVADAQAITAKLVEIVSEQSSLNKETNLALSRMSEAMSHLNGALLQLQSLILGMKSK